MAFTFQVQEVQYEEPGNTVLIGFIKKGEIRGRELVAVPTQSQIPFQSHIISMEVEGPISTPVPASQGSRIQLVLKGCPANRDVLAPSLASSIAPVEPPLQPTVDRSNLLGSPLFWAMWYSLQIGTDEVDGSEFMQPFFGLSNDAVDEFYLENFSNANTQAPWALIRIPLPKGYSLELQFAGQPYCEDRYILAQSSWHSSVLLGYHSGHFALPAFRWQEVMAIGKSVALTSLIESDRLAAPLLFFPGVYLKKDEDLNEIRSYLMSAWKALGVVKSDGIQEMVDQIMDRLTVENVCWQHDPDLGWINDGPYSLRNPSTRMTEFHRENFQKITAFTDMLEEYSG